MARRVTVDQLAETLQGLLEEYGWEQVDHMEEAVTVAAKEGAAAVATSAREKLGGKTYASGWTYKVTRKRMNVEGVIYNKKQPGLAHLLENGHVTRNGTGRTYRPTPAHPHIAEVEEQIEYVFERTVKTTI